MCHLTSGVTQGNTWSEVTQGPRPQDLCHLDPGGTVLDRGEDLQVPVVVLAGGGGRLVLGRDPELAGDRDQAPGIGLAAGIPDEIRGGPDEVLGVLDRPLETPVVLHRTAPRGTARAREGAGDRE